MILSKPMAPVPERYTRVLNWFLNTILVAFLVLALTSLLSWFASRSRLSAILGSLASVQNPNGSVTRPTEGGVNAVIARIPFVAGFFAICAISLALFKGKLRDFLKALPSEWPDIRKSLQEQFLPGWETRCEIGAILAVCAIGVFLRLWHLGRPIRYDEAATYLNFASKPFYRALSNYSYPNNHLLNTFLARLSILVLGDTTLALRLPALLAGILTIPMAWLTGRILYNRLTGIFSASFAAALPTFIEFSVNARGYSLQWVCILAMMCCSAMLLTRPSWKTAWLCFVIAGVAGLYSIPTMVIPILACVVWLLFAGFLAGGWTTCRNFLWNLARAGFAMGILAILLYIPPLLASGPAAILSNRFVASRGSSFLDGLGSLAHSTWIRWTDGVPPVFVYVLVGGIFLGILFHAKVSACSPPMTAVLWICSFCFAWARNIVGYPRVWHYLLLAAVLTGSGGLALVIKKIVSQNRRMEVTCVLSIGLAGLIGVSVIQQDLLFRTNETAALVDTSQVVDFLRANVRPGDALVVCHPATPIIEYELLHQDPKLYVSLVEVESAHHVLAVVPKPEVDSELYRTEELGARLKAQDSADPSAAGSQIDLSQFSAPQTVAKFQSVTVYTFDRVQIQPSVSSPDSK